MDGSTYDGINCGSFTGSVTISGNAIYNIPGLAINNRTTTLIDASGNWLDTNTPTGVAAEVTDYVDSLAGCGYRHGTGYAWFPGRLLGAGCGR